MAGLCPAVVYLKHQLAYSVVGPDSSLIVVKQKRDTIGQWVSGIVRHRKAILSDHAVLIELCRLDCSVASRCHMASERPFKLHIRYPCSSCL
jgi:hypothetical protein